MKAKQRRKTDKGSRRQTPEKSKRGVALISVLTILTLATILVLTFFTLAQNEMTASNNYSNGIQAKALADTAVNMVIGQIRKATADGERLWASQPGAIRTYGADGLFHTGYKLYSSGEMEVAGDENNFAAGDFGQLGTWDSQLARFVDLNAPVIRGEKVFFPIVDPLARDEPGWMAPTDYDSAGVEGFDYDLSQIGPSPVADKVLELTDREVLPMPVEWIYQLQDGTLGYLDSSMNFVAAAGGGSPSTDNPIVGRVAFWADDETSKLNVNVNVGGAAWDTPRAGGVIDMNLGRFQPAQHEWQRYPGHPSSTSLLPVLSPGIANISKNEEAMEWIFRLIPRVVGGGSHSGWKVVNPSNPTESNGLIADKDRLYPSMDDFLLKPGGHRGYDHTNPRRLDLITRVPNEFPDASRGRQKVALIEVENVRDHLERTRFFLSVKGRAPEVTAFNTPRVSIWPTYYATSDDEYRERLTPFDKTIRFAAQIGGDSNSPYAYHFQRMNADSPTIDYTGIPRNQDLYGYLDYLTREPLPGHGISFRDKYGKENQLQLITQIFDYIRCTNLFDDTVYDMLDPEDLDSWRGSFQLVNDDDHLTYTNYRYGNPTNPNGGGGDMHLGHGQVVPIRIDYDGEDTKGFGRFFGVAEVAVHLIKCATWNNQENPDSRWHKPDPDVEGGPNLPSASPFAGAQNRQLSNYPPIPYGDGQDDLENIAGDEVVRIHRYDDGMEMREWNVFDSPEWPLPTQIANAVYNSWPGWIKTLYDDADYGEIEAAFFEGNWNPMLAWAESTSFRDAVASDAIDGRYLIDYLPEGPHLGDYDMNNEANDLRLGQDEHLVQAAILIKIFCPSKGYVPLRPDFQLIVDASDVSFVGTDGNIGFDGFEYASSFDPGPQPSAWNGAWFNTAAPGSNGVHQLVSNIRSLSSLWGGNQNGGNGGFRYLMRAQRDATGADLIGSNPGFAINAGSRGSGGRRAPFDTFARSGEVDADNIYPLITRPFKVSGSNSEVGFNPGVIQIAVQSHRGGNPTIGSTNTEKVSTPVDGVPVENVQYLSIQLPSDWNRLPMPQISGSMTLGYDKKEDVIYHRPIAAAEFWSLSHDGAVMGTPYTRPYESVAEAQSWPDGGGAYGRGRLASVNGRPGGQGAFIRSGDTVWGMSVAHGDFRLLSAVPEVNSSSFVQFEAHPNSTGAGNRPRKAHGLFTANGRPWPGAGPGAAFAGTEAGPNNPYNLVPWIRYSDKRPDPIYGGEGGETAANYQLFGDFDNGVGLDVDGAFINKPDEGNTHGLSRINGGNRTRFADGNSATAGTIIKEGNERWVYRHGEYPYFAAPWVHQPSSPSYFSPNRMLPSAGMFGSLPTASRQPATPNPGNSGAWQTLLFRPNVAGGNYTTHPGAEDPPDHLLLDFFWMPVVEPYAISEGLSTAGKVNLNYQMLPFRHITRSTAMRGVFQSEWMLCVPNMRNSAGGNSARNWWSASYKVGAGRGHGYHWKDCPDCGELQRRSLRMLIVEDETLTQFEDKFASNEIFRTASEICEVHLVPQDVAIRYPSDKYERLEGTYTPEVEEMADGSFWGDHAVVGDNSRERPYANIYPRVTTKSNTFKVHVRAQVVKKAKGTDPARWDPELDTVAAEYRGSAIVERYLDPTDEDIPDYATEPDRRLSEPLGVFYRFRVMNEKHFSP